MDRRSSKCLPSTNKRALSLVDIILAMMAIGDGASLGEGLFPMDTGVSTTISLIGDVANPAGDV